MPQGPIELNLPRRPLRQVESYALEPGVLVHRLGRRERRWLLARLRRVVIGVRKTPYGASLRFIRLTFAGLGLGQSRQTLACGPEVDGYAAFVRALALAASSDAQSVRFEAQGSYALSLLVGLAAALAAGALALVCAAFLAQSAPLGLDLAARLAFLLILIAALTPWIGRTVPPRLDPRALPAHLTDP